MQPFMSTPFISLASNGPSCSGTPGARWWPSRLLYKRPPSCAVLFCSRATTSRVVLSSPNAVPVIGDALRHTISPPLSRLLLPGGIRAMFAPAPVPEHFDRLFPKELMLRPLQLRASAEDAALMTPAVMELEQHYRELKLPVVILTGGDDQIADVGRQSERLHQEISQSELIVLPGLGHMVHHLAPNQVINAIDRAAELAGAASPAQHSPATSHLHEVRPNAA